MRKLRVENFELRMEPRSCSFVFIRGLFFSALIAVACCLLPVASQQSFAQMSAEELRKEQIETIEALKRTEDISGGSSRLFGDLGRRTGWLFQYGASSSVTYTGGDNGSDRNSAVQDAQDHNYDYEMKPFITVQSADRKSKFYTRGTTKYTETKKSSVGAGTRGNNFIQPTVEMMYWEKSFEGKTPGVKSKLTIGRQFVQVGRGIAFAQTADGFLHEMTGLAKNKGEFKWFALRQNPSDDQTDASASGSGNTHRWFWGLRGKYQVHPKAKMSLYYVGTKDDNVENDPTSALQKHKFEPSYYGAVSEGRITKDLQYWSEYIYERGKTYSNGAVVASQKVNIAASALVTGLKYYFGGDLAPTAFSEYITATGDPDALTSSNSTKGGSAAGTNDSRFNPFGGVSLGLALSPTMTNMKVYKFGGSIKPFGRSPNKLVQEMSLQPEYYVFRRRTGNLGSAGNDGVIPGTATTNRIGDELDFSVSWRLMSDVTYQLKYGHFSPGSAYTTQSAETYWRFKISVDL